MTEKTEKIDGRRSNFDKRQWRFGGLAVKVLLVVIPIELAILAVIGFFYTGRVGSAIDERLRARIEVPGELIARSVMNISSVADPEAIRNLVGADLINGLVIDQNGQVIYSLDSKHRGTHVQDVFGLRDFPFAAIAPAGLFFETQNGLAKVTPVYTVDPQNPAYFTVFEISTQRARDEKWSILRQLMLGSIVVTVLTAICIFLLFRIAVGSRLRRTLGVLDRLSGGDLSARVGKDASSDEISVLQREIDAMANRLESRDREKREVQAAQKESEARFRDFADTAADWFWETDRNFRVRYVSEGFRDRTQVSSSAVVGRRLEELEMVEFQNPRRAVRFLKRLRSRRRFQHVELSYRTDDGDKRVARVGAKPIYATNGRFEGYRGSGIDVTEEVVLSSELSYQASHDDLTGLVNRREFEIRLRRALINARDESRNYALCYLDLDQFKVVNDTCGHIAGDEMLRRLGAVLQKTVRQGDTLARLGGDEFGILLENCDLTQAQKVAGKILEAVADFQFEWEESRFKIGVSIGLVPITEHSGDVSDVLSAADTACYEAKDQGRNRFHTYDVDDEDLVRRYGDMQWVGRINRALDEERFVLYYQPVKRIRNRGTVKQRIELLVRMIDEDRTVLLPGSFLPAAERYGLAVKLDRWVVENAITWLSTHVDLSSELEMCSINVSGHTLSDSTFADFVIDELQRSSVSPSLICFEITETAAVANLKSALFFMKQLNRIGCRFALDDFGSGVSSFAYLRSLPVDVLKIDGQFVREMATDDIDAGMVTAIQQIAKVMNKETVAEFADSEAVLAKLEQIGVDFAQGYAIGRPAPLSTFAAGRRGETAVMGKN